MALIRHLTKLFPGFITLDAWWSRPNRDSKSPFSAEGIPMNSFVRLCTLHNFFLGRRNYICSMSTSITLLTFPGPVTLPGVCNIQLIYTNYSMHPFPEQNRTPCCLKIHSSLSSTAVKINGADLSPKGKQVST